MITRENLLQEFKSRTKLGNCGIIFSESLTLSSFCEISSSRFQDIYRLLPSEKCDPSIQVYQRVGKQVGMNLDTMTRKAMLKQLSAESDYLFYQKIHDITDRSKAVKMRIIKQKENVFPLFSSLHKELDINVNCLPFEDRKFLDKAKGALDKWLAVSNEEFKKNLRIDSCFGNLSVNSYSILIDLISNL